MVAISSKFDNSTIPANSTSLVFATFSKLVTIMLSVVGVVVLFPVAVGPLVLVLLYRRLLQSVGPWVRPQLTKMVTARGAIFSGDAVYCRERTEPKLLLPVRFRFQVLENRTEPAVVSTVRFGSVLGRTGLEPRTGIEEPKQNRTFFNWNRTGTGQNRDRTGGSDQTGSVINVQ
ncbi:hypothetical protein Fcan01_27308 [Folsomia candida]|uniref:Uncharacterized protein n=1 Tax=Folsomia candida TaxID=158441 RepID=A0A226D0X0_FOLCA|nr:hypothetical protein Fcan01_27308 [Folsomia candida]